MKHVVDIETISFPVLAFSQGFANVFGLPEILTTSTKYALGHSGYYSNVLLVESSGKAYRIVEAKKLHGIGLLRGYNIFFNQVVKVQLLCKGQPFYVSLEEVKQQVLHSFQSWHGWAMRGDFEELEEKVKSACSINAIIALLE